MITSESHLLSHLVELSETKVLRLPHVQSPSHIRLINVELQGRNVVAEINRKKEWILRRFCTVSYFLRLSWLNKLTFLSKIMRSIRTMGSISLLLKTLYSASGKMPTYCKASISVDFIYDKELSDHNRMLADDVLRECMDADLAFFHTLDDAEQVSFVLYLMRIGGGAIIRKMYERMVREYNNRREQHRKTLASSTQVVIPGTTAYGDDMDIFEIEKRRKSLLMPQQSDACDSNTYDPKDSVNVEVEKQRAIWHKMLQKYEQQIDAATLKPEKKDKKKKNKKKGKKDSVGADFHLDWIQLLPIHLVKRIFSYVDDASLRRAKKVDTYWAYAVKDVLKDRKAQQFLERTSNSLLSCLNVSDASELKRPKSPPPVRLSYHERKMATLNTRAAIDPKLRITNEPLVNTSILCSALQLMADAYMFPVNQTSMFPRLVKMHTIPLYCPAHDLCHHFNVVAVECAEHKVPDCTCDESVQSVTDLAQLLHNEQSIMISSVASSKAFMSAADLRHLYDI